MNCCRHALSLARARPLPRIRAGRNGRSGRSGQSGGPGPSGLVGFVVLGLGVSLLSACSPPIQPTGFLPDYANLARIQGVDFSAMVISPIDTPTTPAIVAINGVAWLARQPGDARAELAGAIEASLVTDCYWAALMYYPSPTIITRETSLKSYKTSLNPVYRLEVAVTDVRPGSGFLRWLINTYAGAVKLQAEFRLREARTNRLLAIFATRRIDPGYAHGGLNFYVFSARYCLERVARDVAGDVIPLAGAVLAGEPLPFVQTPSETNPNAPPPAETDPSKMSETF